MYWTSKSDVVVPPRFETQLSDLKLSPNQICFLYCLIATCGHMKHAAQAARISKATHNWWMHSADNKDDYATAYARVKPMAAQALLDHAIDRATNGTQKPIFYKGELVGYENQYSDTLMVLLLKGEYPEKYRERSETQISNKPGEVMKLDPGRETLTDQKLAALLDLGSKLLEEEKAVAAAKVEKK
jgi:hypothetical protein